MEEVKSLMSTTPVLLLTVSLLFVYFLLVWIFDKKHKHFPPGPRGWRDNLTFLKASMDGTLPEVAVQWAKKYGDLTFINCLGARVLIVNNPLLARKIYSSDDYKMKVADKLVTGASHLGLCGDKGFLFVKYDGLQKKKRRMFFKLLELYGNGVEKFEKVVQGEMDRLLEELEQHENQDFDICLSLSKSLKHILYILALGELPTDPKTVDILEEYDLAMNKLLEPGYDSFLTYFPLLAKLSGKLQTEVGKLLKAKKAAVELLYEFPKKIRVPGNPRGMADLLFEWQTKPGYEWMAEDHEHIVGFLLSLFLAAHVTSRATLLGAFLCLVNYPKVAKKIREEIDNVIGDRPPRVEDKADMPYTSAFILELLRLLTQVPLSSPRISNVEFTLEGFIIPKGTQLLANTWYFHHNENTWEDPWTLKPERFLSSNGQLVGADDPVRKNTFPFGAGVRSCPGEVFARTRVFLVMTNILQKYDLLPPASEKTTPADFRFNDDCTRGLVRQIPPFKCRLQRRKKASH